MDELDGEIWSEHENKVRRRAEDDLKKAPFK